MGKKDKLAKKLRKDGDLTAAVADFESRVKHLEGPPHVVFHIPKVGGSAYMNASNVMAKDGHIMPLMLAHAWNLRMVKKALPDLKVCALIRDPLERTVSGFNSRWRQGRPTRNSFWRPEEAISFSIYRDVRAFLDALISEDEFDLSATKFALANIHHLSHGFSFYFGNVRFIEKNKDNIAYIAHVNDSLELWKILGAQTGVPEEVIEQNFVRAHVSPVSTKSILDEYSAGDIEKMKSRLKREYNVYEALKGLVNVHGKSGKESA